MTTIIIIKIKITGPGQHTHALTDTCMHTCTDTCMHAQMSTDLCDVRHGPAVKVGRDLDYMHAQTDVCMHKCKHACTDTWVTYLRGV